jgi:hypothetical protein
MSEQTIQAATVDDPNGSLAQIFGKRKISPARFVCSKTANLFPNTQKTKRRNIQMKKNFLLSIGQKGLDHLRHRGRRTLVLSTMAVLFTGIIIFAGIPEPDKNFQENSNTF